MLGQRWQDTPEGPAKIGHRREDRSSVKPRKVSHGRRKSEVFAGRQKPAL